MMSPEGWLALSPNLEQILLELMSVQIDASSVGCLPSGASGALPAVPFATCRILFLALQQLALRSFTPLQGTGCQGLLRAVVS